MSPLGAGSPQLPPMPMPLPLHMVGALADPSSPAPMSLTKDGKIPKKRGGARKKGFDMQGNAIDSVPRSPTARGSGRGGRGSKAGRAADRGDRETSEPGSPAPTSARGRGRGRGGARGERGKRAAGNASRGDSASNAGTPGGPTPGASTGLPYDLDTPGGGDFTPGDSNGGREASVFSGTTRRSGNTRGRSNAERGDGETEYDDEDEEDDDIDMEADALFADGAFDEELMRQRAEEKEARGCVSEDSDGVCRTLKWSHSLLVEQFDEEQMQRYTEFTRSRFQPGNIRKVR